MATTKFTVSLRGLKLTQKELKQVIDGVDKRVTAELKKIAPVKKAKPKKKSIGPSRRAISKAVSPATVTATFRNTDPGFSELNAKHKNDVQILDRTGTLTFQNVMKGDIIRIIGKSLGNSDISVDVSASPQREMFEPGVYRFNFIIL